MTNPNNDKLTPAEFWFSAFCLAGSLVTLIICACIRFFN